MRLVDQAGHIFPGNRYKSIRASVSAEALICSSVIQMRQGLGVNLRSVQNIWRS